MTLNERPIGAAEYCYNKNKRADNSPHQPEYVEWFLPTISEIEYAMDRYYTDYADFRGKYYWSSNPGAIGNNGVGNEGENPENARATKTNTWNEEEKRFEHAPSAVNETYPTYVNKNTGERCENCQYTENPLVTQSRRKNHGRKNHNGNQTGGKIRLS